MEEKKEYLNEEEYQRNNAKLKKIGKILLVVGIIILVISFIMTIMGFLGFGNTATDTIGNIGSNFWKNGDVTDININTGKVANGIFGSFGIIAFSGFVSTIGFILTVVGGVIMFITHRREIAAYSMQQGMPIAKEGIEKMTPTVAKATGSIAKEVSKGIKEGINEASKEQGDK
jgi:uncharacterized membrane protein